MKNFEKFKTAEDRVYAFHKFCQCRDCIECPLEKQSKFYALADCCMAFWLELEAEKEEPLPCPFCGSRCLAIDGSKIAPDRHGVRPNSYVKCEKCGYESILTYDYDNSGIEDIIAAHNRVAKAVIGAKKEVE